MNLNIRNFGRRSLISWTEADLRKERIELENDYDYECQDCGHRFTVPFDQFYPPDDCIKCDARFSFLPKETIEENERINARES